MGDWSVALDDLPEFQDGYPLSAELMNRIGAAQDYLNERYERVFPGMPIMILEVPADANAAYSLDRSMFFVHLHRYLHWSFDQDGAYDNRTFRMLINGHRAIEISGASSSLTNSGVIDLNGTDMDGNAYGLTIGKIYELQWKTISTLSLSGRQGFAYKTFECATNNASIALPVSNPTFSDGGVPDAADLNALVTNCNYLLQENGLLQSPGYQYEKRAIPHGDLSDIIYVTHHHNYLTCRFDILMGDGSFDITTDIKLNGSSIYNDLIDVEVSYPFGGTKQYKLFLNLASYSLSVGQVYEIEIATNNNSFNLAWRTIFFVGESPVNTRPVW